MEESYKNGLAEVDMILNYADEESLAKIPESLKNFIKENKSNYNVKIDPQKDLKNQNLLYETKVILSVLYRDYWASKDERKKLLENEKEELLQIKNSEREEFNYGNLFKQKDNELNDNFEETSLVIKRKTLIKRILDRLKSFFRMGEK